MRLTLAEGVGLVVEELVVFSDDDFFEPIKVLPMGIFRSLRRVVVSALMAAENGDEQCECCVK